MLNPRWVYKSLFMWDMCWGNRIEAAFEDFVLQAPRVEMYRQYRIYTEVKVGEQDLYASSAGLCAVSS